LGKSFVLEAAEDAPMLEEVEESALLIPDLIIADTIFLMLIMTVRIQMLLIMPDILNFKFLEEQLAANASKEILPN